MNPSSTQVITQTEPAPPEKREVTLEQLDARIGEVVRLFVYENADAKASQRVSDRFFSILNATDDKGRLMRLVTGLTSVQTALASLLNKHHGTRTVSLTFRTTPVNTVFAVVSLNTPSDHGPLNVGVSARLVDAVLIRGSRDSAEGAKASAHRLAGRVDGEWHGPVAEPVVDQDGNVVHSGAVVYRGLNSIYPVHHADIPAACLNGIIDLPRNQVRGSVSIRVATDRSSNTSMLYLSRDVLRHLDQAHGFFSTRMGTEAKPKKMKLTLGADAATQVGGLTFHASDRLKDYSLSTTETAMHACIRSIEKGWISTGRSASSTSSSDHEVGGGGVPLQAGSCRLSVAASAELEVKSRITGNLSTIPVTMVMSVLTHDANLETITGTVVFTITIMPGRLPDVRYYGPTGATLDPFGDNRLPGIPKCRVISKLDDGEHHAEGVAHVLDKELGDGDGWTGLRAYRRRGDHCITMGGAEFNDSDHVKSKQGVDVFLPLAEAAIQTIASLSRTDAGGPVTVREIRSYLSRNRIPAFGVGGTIRHPEISDGNMVTFSVEDLLVRWALSRLFLFRMGKAASGQMATVLHVVNGWRAALMQIPMCVFPRGIVLWEVPPHVLALVLADCITPRGSSNSLTRMAGGIRNYRTKGAKSSSVTVRDATEFGWNPMGVIHQAPVKVTGTPINGRNYVVDPHGTRWDYTPVILGMVSTVVERQTKDDAPPNGSEAMYWTREVMIVVTYKRGGEAMAYLHTGARASRLAASYYSSKSTMTMEGSSETIHYAALARSRALGFMGALNSPMIVEQLYRSLNGTGSMSQPD